METVNTTIHYTTLDGKVFKITTSIEEVFQVRPTLSRQSREHLEVSSEESSYLDPFLIPTPPRTRLEEDFDEEDFDEEDFDEEDFEEEEDSEEEVILMPKTRKLVVGEDAVKLTPQTTLRPKKTLRV